MICKWMGWSYRQLSECPAEYIPLLCELIDEANQPEGV